MVYFNSIIKTNKITYFLPHKRFFDVNEFETEYPGSSNANASQIFKTYRPKCKMAIDEKKKIHNLLDGKLYKIILMLGNC